MNKQHNAITALAKAQSEMPHAELDKDGHNHKYATLKSIINAVRKPLNDNGFIYTHIANQDEYGPYVDTVLLHESGQKFDTRVHYKLKYQNNQDVGGGLTYAKRYGLAMITGISAEENDPNEENKPDKDKPNVNRPNKVNKIKEFIMHTSSDSKGYDNIENAIMAFNSVLSKQLEKYQGEERVKIGTIMKTKNADLMEKIKEHNPEIYNQVYSKLEKFND
tara:strand:+ start:394 stop:1053 length:660 start_codon:yes stop_codon:yes gene_type:complete